MVLFSELRQPKDSALSVHNNHLGSNMKSLSFTIPGQPVAKARARMTRTGHCYTPVKTMQAEHMIATVSREIAKMEGWVLVNGGLTIEVIFRFELPSSWRPKKRCLYLNEPHMQKPDLDNCIKLLCDSINQAGNIWGDDAQVYEIKASKVWAETGSTFVKINA